MERYLNYKLEDFLLDISFREWVGSGAIPDDSIWAELAQHPEKKEVLEEAIVLLRGFKRQPSAISDEQMLRDIGGILDSINRKEAEDRGVWWRWAGYAATVVLAVGLGWYFIEAPFALKNDELASHTELRDTEIINSGQDDKIVILPDSSLVCLLPGSKLTYSPDFESKGVREMTLTGGAFFDVKRDTLRPFSVFAGGLTTRVLGTSFTVRTGTNDISVVVNTGKVVVSASGEKREPLILTPNQKAIYVTAEQKLTRSISEAPVVVDKTQLEGRFAFDEEPAGNIFLALEKAYGIPIRFDKAALKTCYVTLPFREEPFFQKLEILCRTIKASYVITDDGIIIESDGCQ